MKNNNAKNFPRNIYFVAINLLTLQFGYAQASSLDELVIVAQANVNINQSTKSSSRNTDAIITTSLGNAIPISIYPGQVRVIEQADVERIAIGNGKLVTATVVANKQIVLLGEAAGVTSLYVWLKNGGQRNYEITVTFDDAQKTAAEKTAAELRALLTLDPEVKVTTVGERLVFNGKYSNQETAEKIKKIAAAYPQVLNLINQEPAEKLVTPEKMVLFEVKIIEVKKSAIDKLGIRWNTSTAGPTFNNNALLYSNTGGQYGIRNQDPNSLLPIATLARPWLSVLGIASSIASSLNFLESNGDLWTISQPRISTVSGGKSKIQVGGQLPVPVATGLGGAIAIVYKDYGVTLEVQPVVDSLGNIRAKITSEVTEVDTAVAGTAPSFFTTKTDSEVSLKDNETLVISGLLKNNGKKSKDGIKGLMDIPIAGRLFSEVDYANDRIEMMIVVTPRLHTPDSEKNILEQQNAIDEIKRVNNVIETK
jgi:pilus assembly protein CpaC